MLDEAGADREISGLVHVPKPLPQKRHTELFRVLKLLVLAPGRRRLTGSVCSVLKFLVLTPCV